MQLTLVSPQNTIFQWEVIKATVPTDIGLVTMLPWHVPMCSIVKPWILSFLPKEKTIDAFIEWTEFLFKDDEVHVSVSHWSIYVDNQSITILVSEATSNPASDTETLEKIKQDLERDIEEIKLRWDIDSIEKAYLSLQKITADLKLSRMKHVL